MSIYPRDIKDQVVQYPDRFKIDGVSHTIEPDFGVTTAPGTPVNKALLQPYEDGVMEVGDIRQSLRSDLHEKWLLCNGMPFDPEEYPALAAMSESKVVKPWDSLQLPTGASTYYAIRFVNGYWVVCANSGKVFYRAGNDPAGSWSTNTVGSGNVYDIIYAGSYWALCTGTGVYYKTGASPAGAWTSPAANSAGISIAYANGYWVVVPAGTSRYIRYASNLAGPWTQVDAAGESGDYVLESVRYGNGYWCVRYDTSRLYYKAGPSPAGSWSYSYVGGGDRGLLVANGYFLVAGKYATAPNGPWTNIAGAQEYIYTDNPDTWVGVGYRNSSPPEGRLSYKKGSSPSSPWQDEIMSESRWTSIAKSPSHWAALGMDGTVSYSKYIEAPYTPVIDAGPAYAYIKGRD